MTLPGDVRDYPEAIAQALSQLRLVGVNGPYSVLLGADAYTALAETSDHGYPVLEHVQRLVKDQIIWAPAIAGAFVLTTRGGDFDLHIGQDVSIGYPEPHGYGGPPVPAGDVHFPPADYRSRGGTESAGKTAELSGRIQFAFGRMSDTQSRARRSVGENFGRAPLADARGSVWAHSIAHQNGTPTVRVCVKSGVDPRRDRQGWSPTPAPSTR